MQGVERRKFYFRRNPPAPPRPARDSTSEEVDTSTTFLGQKLSFPLLISCMTGGDHDPGAPDQPPSGRGGGGVRRGHGSGLATRHVQPRPKARESFALRRSTRPPRCCSATWARCNSTTASGFRECRAKRWTCWRRTRWYLHLNPAAGGRAAGGRHRISAAWRTKSARS
jgi:hypothetical protein